MEYYQKEDRFYLALSLYAMFILPITKRTGIIDAMIFFFIIYSAMILHRKYDLKKVWKIMVMYLVLSFGSYLSWEAYIASSGGKGRGLLSAVVGIAGKLASRGALFVAAGVVVLIAGVLFVVILQNKHPRIIVGSIAIAFSAACLLFMRSYDSPAELKEEATVMVLRSLFGFDYRGYGENIKMYVFQIQFNLFFCRWSECIKFISVAFNIVAIPNASIHPVFILTLHIAVSHTVYGIIEKSAFITQCNGAKPLFVLVFP